MLNTFEFGTSARIVFGDGKRHELGALARPFGTRALVVCGRDTRRAAPALEMLEATGIHAVPCPIPGEPRIEDARRGAALAREQRCELVVGFGGGSALDAAKAIAALATNTRDVLDYLEVIGRAQSLENPPLPIIAVPTTAGTGSEATRNAVLASPEHRVKASLRSALMLPRVALVDPELTHDLPPSLTASTGMDALTQLIEPFVSTRANPMTDALCREAIPRAARSLARAFTHPQDAEARRDMALASLFGGLALANAGLGAVHGLAAPVGGMFPAPHGAVCAALLPEVMEMNIRMAQTSGASTAPARFDEVARLLTGSPTARASDGVSFVQELRGRLLIPRLRDFSITLADLSIIAEKAAQTSSMKGNPVPLPLPQLLEILEGAL